MSIHDLDNKTSISKWKSSILDCWCIFTWLLPFLERKTKKASAKVEIEKPLIPQNQEEYDKFISNYKNDEFFAYDPYSYYEIENELLRHRQPQPKKPALY